MERDEWVSRQEAGRKLVVPLRPYAGPDLLVLGVSRGGILVGLEIAQALGAPFEPLAIHTLNHPQRPEQTTGVVVEPDFIALHDDEDTQGAPSSVPHALHEAAEQGKEDVQQRGLRYRGGRPLQDVAGRRVIVASDAASTGTTLRGVVASLRARGARKIIIALPVAPPDVLAELRERADGVIHLDIPASLIAQRIYYPQPHELDDEDLIRLLQEANQPGSTAS